MAKTVKHSKWYKLNVYFTLTTLMGLIVGYCDLPSFNQGATVISEVFINLLKLVSLPIIFLSIISTAASMQNMDEIKRFGTKVAKYTFATTIIAASIAFCLFIIIHPVQSHIDLTAMGGKAPHMQTTYLDYLVHSIPSNIIAPFVENNVIGVLFLAILLSFAILALPNKERQVLHNFFSSCYLAMMKITSWILKLMPIAIFAFVVLFINDLRAGMQVSTIAYYLACVILANIIQAFIVLPIFLKSKGISPMKIARGMFPALSVAFFSKSSSGALPVAMKCADENLKIPRKVANFTLPLCTTINMNGCAAFIFTTVLFVSMSNGIHFTMPEMIMWIFVATIAAIGNAGVPMGCYFLSSAFLAAMNVPLNILGIILPFYAFIDMLESAINVWSDSCVTVMVHHELEAGATQTQTIQTPIDSTARLQEE